MILVTDFAVPSPAFVPLDGAGRVCRYNLPTLARGPLMAILHGIADLEAVP